MSDLIGKSVGPYRIIEQVGVGGMATVYKAYQASMDRYLALKILPHYVSEDQNFAKRFQREARAIAKLEHPHILPVYDYGEADGVTYIAMRYVEAGTLKQHLAKGPLPLKEINRLIGQIGSALDYAHRLGVIHRDVKPSNVLIDEQGNTYLTDFGLARMMEVSQELTGSGVGVGTPAYMSPEQGQGVKADHRSDLYSLGVILYEMATGHVPFEAETPMAVMLKHITDPLPLPRALKPDVPEAIERVILKALAKAPGDRFQTAAEMVQALGMASRKVSAAEPERPIAPAPTPVREDMSLVTRVGRLWEQPRGKVALGGGALAALVVLGLLLSRLPGNVRILGPGAAVTTTSTPVAQAAAPTREAAPTAAPANTTEPTRTPLPTQVPLPTATPELQAQGERLKLCTTGTDLCVVDGAGNSTALGLAEDYLDFRGFGLSPDGSQVVFAACVRAELQQNPDYQFCHDIFIADKDGSNAAPLVQNVNIEDTEPSWSPDSEWIAIGGWSLSIIHPDGTDLTTLIPVIASTNVAANAWSPDSQLIAYVSGSYNAELSWGFLNEVSIVNRDGSNGRMIFNLPDPRRVRDDLIMRVAWSPDGQAVAIQFDDGRAYLIDADCDAGTAGCLLSDLAEIPEIPQSWLDTFHPQWLSATEVPPTPAPTSSAESSNLPFPVPAVEVSGKALYVDAGAASGGDGSQSRPFNTLQAAIDKAGKGDTIKVAVGVYDENLIIKRKTLVLQGGYDPGAWKATGNAADTVIDGGARARVIAILEGSHIVMEGFAVTNGKVECPTPEYYGGGGGFAVVGPDTEVTLQRLVVSHNTVETCGGGGLEVTEATAVLINSFITGNTANDTAGIAIWINSRVMLINSTVADNRPDGVGRYDNYEAEGFLLNSIVWGNTGKDVFGKDIAVVNSLVGVNPRFVDRANGDYHLQFGSPAIDAGALAGAPTVDIDGDPRPIGLGVDIGADEFMSETARQVRAFVEPILQAIANRPPDAQNDFSRATNGWGAGSDQDSARDYVNGEYVVIVKPNHGTGAGPGKGFVFSDFVAEVDARIVSATGPGGWGFIFREQSAPSPFRYHINVDSVGLVIFVDTGAYTDLFTLQGAPVRPAPQTNHLLVIAKGPNIALYVNGEPVTVVHDTTLSSGIVSLGIHAGDQETEVHFDNFKIWDISDLP